MGVDDVRARRGSKRQAIFGGGGEWGIIGSTLSTTSSLTNLANLASVTSSQPRFLSDGFEEVV